MAIEDIGFGEMVFEKSDFGKIVLRKLVFGKMDIRGKNWGKWISGDLIQDFGWLGTQFVYTPNNMNHFVSNSTKITPNIENAQEHAFGVIFI